ncbi:glycosyltransferase, partial [Georgenia sp. 10Sc9-8]|nr:glycosyltransferase [Georgenia halotolerans]
MSENSAGDLGPPLPTVSVVVPVRNDVERLRRCLDLLRRQDYPPDRYEVIVVDNNSTDDIAGAVPSDPRFRLVHEGRR